MSEWVAPSEVLLPLDVSPGPTLNDGFDIVRCDTKLVTKHPVRNAVGHIATTDLKDLFGSQLRT